MATSPAQLQFAGEFVLFLVALAGVAVLTLRAGSVVDRGWGRTALVTGFLALATAAFLHGSLVVDNVRDPVIVATRAFGAVAVLAGAARWKAGRRSQLLLVAGSALVGSGIVASVVGQEVPGAIGRAAGGVAIGVALVAASRRSIIARIATSAAATLLLVVLVLSVALSAVLSSTVEDQAILRLGELAQIEARHAEVTGPRDVQGYVNLAAASLVGDQADELLARDEQPARSPQIEDHLDRLREEFLSDQLALAYVTPGLTVLAATEPLTPQLFTPLVAMDVVTEAIDTGEPRTSAQVIAGEPAVVGAKPVYARPPDGQRRLLGAVVGVQLLDRSYLDVRRQPDTSYLIVGARGVLASSTPSASSQHPPDPAVTRLASGVIASGEPASEISDDWIIRVEPVETAAGEPVMAFAVATRTTVINEVRDSLFRTLFLIALGGAVLGLVLAAFVGDRIGSGLRRLTGAAEAVQRGEEGVRAEIVSEDEVGVLGAAFDSMVASNEDKTAALRKAADDETRLRNRLEAIVAGMGEALVAVDADGRITDFNHAAETLVGVAAATANGQPVDEVISGQVEDGSDLGRRVMVPGWRWTTVGVVRNAAGEDIPVAASAGVLEGPGGELAGGVFVFRDLRREREVERMKTEFLSRVGHELRTPLAPIVGYATILSTRDVDSDRVRELARNIHGSAERLSRIVQMLEFFSSTQAGRTVLKPEAVEVRALIDDVVARWRVKNLDGHSIRRRVARNVQTAWVDAKWVAIAIDELVDNAVKFSPDGGLIRITADRVEGAPNGSRQPGQTMIRISITDRGKGMTADEQDRAFTEFSQGDESDTRQYGGLGLGLALVKEVVERHGGHVTGESAGPGSGSKFSIDLPFVPIEEADEDANRRARNSRGRRAGSSRGVRPA